MSIEKELDLLASKINQASAALGQLIEVVQTATAANMPTPAATEETAPTNVVNLKDETKPEVAETKAKPAKPSKPAQTKHENAKAGKEKPLTHQNIIALASAGIKEKKIDAPKVMSIIEEYGAGNISGVPDDKIDEVYARIQSEIGE